MWFPYDNDASIFLLFFLNYNAQYFNSNNLVLLYTVIL